MGGDFTSQANFSQSIPDSDNNKEDNEAGKLDMHGNNLMTIKEKLNRGRVHSVPGYNDSENMWYKIISLEKDSVPNPNKY